VITEAMFLLEDTPQGPMALADFIGASNALVYDLAQPAELKEAAALMQRYGDTPMDYADATLVLLAEALQVHRVLTLDRRGFSTYRTRSRKSFTLAPA
jgi:predicted nucleic acid-binding protein